VDHGFLALAANATWFAKPLQLPWVANHPAIANFHPDATTESMPKAFASPLGADSSSTVAPLTPALPEQWVTCVTAKGDEGA